MKKASQIESQPSANRLFVFAKNCTNTHGSFKKGDKARGAFSQELIDAYLQAGILAKMPDTPANGDGNGRDQD